MLVLAQTTTVEYLHTGALGTPVAVTDAAGAVIERSEYEPYGQLVNRPLTDGPGFTGHVQDAATGLTYMQQRYYDPTIGRFLSVDPVTAYSMPGANFNRYWYANNNPYAFLDPDGRLAQDDKPPKPSEPAPPPPEPSTVPDPSSVRSPNTPLSPVRQSNPVLERLGLSGDLTKNGNILDMDALAHDLFYPLMDSPEGAPIKAASLLIVKLGRAGEDAVRAAYNIGQRGFFRTGFRMRFPDGMTATTISEIKNTKYLSYNSQIRDYADFVRSTGRSFDLYVRPDAILSGPLVQVIRAGDINLKIIP